MTVFLAHAFADLDAAEALAKSIERRGLFVEHEDGERVGRALQTNDAVVLLWSEITTHDPNRLLLERRALDAWSEDRLILIALDRPALPVGLRDLSAIDASDAGRWPAAWEEANAAIAAALAASGPPQAREAPSGKTPKSAKPAPAARRGLGLLFVLIGLLGLIGLAAYGYQRVQYAVFDLPEIPAWAFWGGVILIAALFMFAQTLLRPAKRKRRKARPATKHQSEAEDDVPQTEAVFVSYAHDDAVAVGPVVAAVERAGRPVWIDKGSAQPGPRRAAEMVRAIRSAHGVMVMCSPAAFQSDHVKREVYLADRYRKPLFPMFIKPAALPADFEYFFAGIPSLDLASTPEAERPEAIRVALEAV
jgi:TIR domain